MLKLENIQFTYPGAKQAALGPVGLEIDKGERICIMGGNGSGKSTLALLIAGVLKAGVGQIRSEPEQADSSGGRRAAILFQNPDSRMVATTVEREIAFSLECEGRPFGEMEPAVEATSTAFGVQDLSQRQSYNLSGGEKQRVALASLFVIKPDLLILDEPDSFLDVAGRQILEQELRRLRQAEKNLTEIRVTQYLSIGAQYDRLLILRDGKLIADGPPDEIMADSQLLESASLNRTTQSESGHRPTLFPSEPDSKTVNLQRIDLERVSFGHGQKRLLDGISLFLECGEITALVGQSGSGKTSLASLVSGLLKPQSGSVRLFDSRQQEVSADKIRGRLVQLVQFPERQFYLATCREEIEAGPSNLGRGLSADKTEAVLAGIGLPFDSFAGRDPLSLSMGEKRRLALGCLLAMNPDFLILDEPACGLDPAAVGWFETLIVSLKEQGKGLLLISHDAKLVRNTADRVIHLSGDGSAPVLTVDGFFARSNWTDTLSEA